MKNICMEKHFLKAVRFSHFRYQKVTSGKKICTIIPDSSNISNKQSLHLFLSSNIFLMCLFCRAMDSLSVVHTPTLIYLALSIPYILIRKDFFLSSTPLLLNVAINYNIKTLLKKQPEKPPSATVLESSSFLVFVSCDAFPLNKPGNES